MNWAAGQQVLPGLPGIQLARALWLQGYPVQAVNRVHETLKEVLDHPVALTGALTWAIGVFFWTGDLASAELHINWFISHAEAYSLGPNVAVGRGLKAQLAIRQGDAKGGVKSLRDCLRKIRAARHGLILTEFNGTAGHRIRGLSACLCERKYFLIQFEGPKQGLKRYGFL
jgi:hypothetical protein